MNIFKQLSESCSFLLKNFPSAQGCRDYLDSRLNKDSQELFQFGYFPPISEIEALTSLVNKTKLYENKLLYSRIIEDSLFPRTIYYSYFDNHPLILPFRDAYGNIIAIIGRSLLSENDRRKNKIAKYKNTVFPKGNHLFGLYENKDSIIEKDFVYIVEGQFDVIKAVEKGLNNIVALSNSNMTNYQFSLIIRYTTNLFIVLDNDEAGEKGRKRIYDKFSKFANICNFHIQESYKDMDEYLSYGGVSSHEDIQLLTA